MSENNATMSAGMPASAPAFGSDVKRLPLKDLLKRIGPGLIATGIVIGPGAVTTASMIGANYGYDLMWLFFPIIFMGITFMMVTNRLAIVTGMPTIHAIRKYYGPVASGIVGCAMFLSCLFFTMGNISGTGAGMNLIFGIDWKIGSVIMLAVVVYMYFAKNVYSKVEKIITLCIVLMIVAFYATLVGVGGPEPQGLAKGLFGFKVPEGSLSTALAFISTNAAVTAGIYGTYLGKEKKWKKDDLFNGVMLTDAITHIVSVSLISGAIVLVGAVVLHPQGLSIKAPAQLAEMLVPIMGGSARSIMGLALVGAYLLSVKGGEGIATGDLLVIASAVVFSLHILVVDFVPAGVDGVKLSCVQFLVAGLLATVLALLFESFTFSDILAAWVPLLYTGIISSGVGYTLQILGQRTVNPTVASLILSLESVFAVLAGWVLLGQPLSPRELVGCALVFAAVVLAQLPQKKPKVQSE